MRKNLIFYAKNCITFTCKIKGLNMAEHIDKVIEVLNKSGKEYTLYFTPRIPKNRVPSSWPYLLYPINDTYVEIRYGYYEIKDSPLGPIMMRLGECWWNRQEDSVDVKVRAIKWTVDANYLHPATLDDVYKFIHRMPVVESGLSEKKADKLFDKYCDLPVPKSAKNIEPPTPNWMSQAVFESADEMVATFEAIRRVNARRPFDRDDFGGTPEPYIPYISLAMPLAVGTAIKMMPLIQSFLMNTYQM